jgi:hypothetical protein
MKKEHLILITAGVLLAVILLSKKKSETIDIIKPGDKGNEVVGLQNAFFNLTGVQSGNLGAYDNKTLMAVRCLLKNSNALVDYDKGYVDRKFCSDLYMIQKNAKAK